ncbi:MAG: bifunctional phosphopantothenoylcysteine decarboxylase/phosphopantothenate--cysteine ligase CoaBC [Oleiphilaceae bacterium]|nr:bifunctional phosphopantothenoylcysteine decarboxylase/phosphopantothenate--cysteine ligase CoaBC [Oleiphilaceae bacterium]
MLAGKKILLGITGGIAAYKAAELCRELVKQGAQVRVILTNGAQQFITPLTLQALSGNAVHTDLLDPDAELGMGHIELAKWSDLILIAPASAHFIAQLAHGLAGDLLLTSLLASAAPLAIAPAMNQAMWQNPVTHNNMQLLQQLYGERLLVWGPSQGAQACGDIGPGRMIEPLELTKNVADFFAGKGDVECCSGLKIVITAGPTREPIDPVRYISNHSSGKMGFALASAFSNRGAQVTLIAGPVNLPTPAGVERVDVVSAQEMYDAAMQHCERGTCNVFIGAAAVADYRVKTASEQKIKKKQENMAIELTRNPDIIAAVAALSEKPFTVGFAAETQDVLAYARDKLQRKKLDMIIANDVSRSDIGFNSDQNEVFVITGDGQQHLNRQSKHSLGQQLAEAIVLAFKKN